MTDNELIANVKAYVLNRWTLGELHGLPHWQRVEKNGILLNDEGVNLRVVRLFAYLHDSKRDSNGYDEVHGQRAAESLDALRDNLLQELTDDEFNLLKIACRDHTTVRTTGNPTIDACFDADRLDLTRVGIIPDPSRMASRLGRYYATANHFSEALAEMDHNSSI